MVFLKGLLDLNCLVAFNHVTDINVVEVIDVESALIT
jgi:hypothetical protein